MSMEIKSPQYVVLGNSFCSAFDLSAIFWHFSGTDTCGSSSINICSFFKLKWEKLINWVPGLINHLLTQEQKRTEKASMLINGKLNVISQEKQKLFDINPIIIDNVL